MIYVAFGIFSQKQLATGWTRGNSPVNYTTRCWPMTCGRLVDDGTCTLTQRDISRRTIATSLLCK